MSKNRRAFTLVELMVVIGVIAVLIAILLPALRRARQAALQTECLSNLHQCAIGFQMYAADNLGYIPAELSEGFDNTGFCFWPGFLCYGYHITANPPMPTAGTAGTKYIDEHLIICPSTLHADVAQTYYNAEQPNIGYALYSYYSTPYAYTVSQGNYAQTGQSSFMQETIFDPLDPPGNEWSIITERPATPISRDGQPISPELMPMLGDSYESPKTGGSMYYGGFGGGHMFANFRSCPDWLVQDYGWLGAPYGGGLQTIHGNYANIAFYDGHAESLTAKDLRANPGIREMCTYDQYGGFVITN